MTRYSKQKQPLVAVEQLVKAYKLYAGPGQRLLDLLTPEKFNFHQQFSALKNINFELKAGQSLGLIGPNGSGKSTLLKVLAGISRKTSGKLDCRGEIASLLDLGVGYHQEFSGRENLKLNCSLVGIKEQDSAEAVARMIDFAELGDFIDRPIRTYSTGMFLRLAFSFISEIDPDILLIDEILAVGDSYFRNKSLRKIVSLKNAGKIIVLASHEMDLVRHLCDQVLWLEEGECKFLGDVRQGILAYDTATKKQIEKRLSLQYGKLTEKEKAKDYNFRVSGKICGSGEIRVVNFVIKDAKGNPCWAIETGQDLNIEMLVYASEEIEEAAFGIFFHDREGKIIAICHSSETLNDWGHSLKGFSKVRLKIAELNLIEGKYFISTGVTTKGYDGTLESAADYQEQIFELHVFGSHLHRAGFFRFPATWQLEKKKEEVDLRLFPRKVTMDNEQQRRFFSGQWHERETDGKYHFSWIGQSAGLLLAASENINYLKLILKTDLPQSEGEDLPLEISCDQNQFLKLRLQSGDWQEHWLKLNNNGNALRHISFFAKKTWCPDKLHHNGDLRQLSVAIRQVSLEVKKV